MARYYFNLPLIIRLTIPQQGPVYETEQIALSGGPGTGKSVVSLLRHIFNYQTNKKSLLLTYTTTLAKYLKACCATQNLDAANNVGELPVLLISGGNRWIEDEKKLKIVFGKEVLKVALMNC